MKILCDERYREAVDYAEKNNDRTLQNCLERLKSWEKYMNAEAHLMRDRSKLSFYFEMYDKAGNRVMNGGIVYHGIPDESYSFTMDPTKGWKLHT